MRLKDKDTKSFLPLDRFEEMQDFLSFFREYLNDRISDYYVDVERRKLLRVSRASSSKSKRVLRGIVLSGEYGYEADLYDMEASTVSYRRSQRDAEMMPFYFLVHLPKGVNEGILILQKRAQFGIRTAFLRDFEHYFNEFYPRIQIEINSLVPPQLINRYLQDGNLTTLRFIRFRIPSDVIDSYEGGGHVEEEGTAELVIKARRRDGIPLLARVRDVVNGNRSVTEMIELRDFDYDNVKVEIELNGKRKIFDLSNIMSLQANYDITQDVAIGGDGHPVFESIDALALDLLEDFRTLRVG